MVRFYWLLFSCLGFLLFCSPAEAGRLLFWRYEASQNQLVFTTDEGVQPTAQLLSNPTRLVIDLPGTSLGRRTSRERVGGAIREIRVGQVDNRTARIVVELAPGYTLDPNQIKFRGASPTQWSVEIPQPYRGTLQAPSRPPSPSPSSQLPPPSAPSRSLPPQTGTDNFRVTNSGFFVNLARGSGDSDRIRFRRSRDKKRIEFELDEVTFPRDLAGQEIAVNRFGVSTIKFEQDNNRSRARVTLNVTEDSPDWSASFRGNNTLNIIPDSRIEALREEERFQGGNPTPQPLPQVGRRERATISSINLTPSGNELSILSSIPIGGVVTRRGDGTYQISIPNATLGDRINQPRIRPGSFVSGVLVDEQDDSVVLGVELVAGVELGQPQTINRGGESFLAIPIARASSSPFPRNPRDSISVPPPRNSTPQAGLPRIPNSQAFVMIDPGHGGRDPGAIGLGNVYEKNVILPISQEVARILQQQGVRVSMTRSDDRFISLQGRAQMANRSGADLFVSIHANAMPRNRSDVNGLETYYYSSGRRLAATIHRSILQNVNIGDRGVKRARFYVLRRTSMPAVLVEVGFLTGVVDSVNLRDPNYRSQMAQAIANGILQYIQQNRL